MNIGYKYTSKSYVRNKSFQISSTKCYREHHDKDSLVYDEEEGYSVSNNEYYENYTFKRNQAKLITNKNSNNSKDCIENKKSNTVNYKDCQIVGKVVVGGSASFTGVDIKVAGSIETNENAEVNLMNVSQVYGELKQYIGDFYIYCVSVDLVSNGFDDYCADVCIEVDLDAFAKNICMIFKKKYFIKCSYIIKDVIYIDKEQRSPLSHESQLESFCTKDKRYSSVPEKRVIFIPENNPRHVKRYNEHLKKSISLQFILDNKIIKRYHYI